MVFAEFFSVFYTLEGRKRSDVLTALQGNPKDGIGLSYNVHTRTLLQVFKVAQADQNKLARLFGNGQPYSKEDFCRLIQQKAGSIAAKKNIFSRIIDSFALGHYFAQENFPVVDLLVTDDATEYQKIARWAQALCWVHDARPYNKLPLGWVTTAGCWRTSRTNIGPITTNSWISRNFLRPNRLYKKAD